MGGENRKGRKVGRTKKEVMMESRGDGKRGTRKKEEQRRRREENEWREGEKEEKRRTEGEVTKRDMQT